MTAIGYQSNRRHASADPLACCRGIAFALLPSLALWAVILWVLGVI